MLFNIRQKVTERRKKLFAESKERLSECVAFQAVATPWSATVGQL
jgi:hypothetical protein